MNFKLALLGAAILLVAGPARGQPLPNNFWPNSHFDNGINLSAADGSGTPTGWVRNGSFSGSLNVIDEVTNVSLPDSTNAIMVNNFSGAERLRRMGLRRRYCRRGERRRHDQCAV